jgi:DNA-binding transcriptional regulator PaaX
MGKPPCEGCKVFGARTWAQLKPKHVSPETCFGFFTKFCGKSGIPGLRVDMKPQTELLLYQLLWRLEQVLAPSILNLSRNFEEWTVKTGCMDRIHELEALGFLERHPESNARGACIVLTETARNLSSHKAHPPSAWSRKWDGTWQQILFDLEADEVTARKQLHRALRHHGFGCLQGSVWVHPFMSDDLRKCCTHLPGRPANLLFLSGCCQGKHTDRWIVEDAWDWDRIESAYDTYIRTVPEYNGPLTVANCRNWVRMEKRAWQQATHADPFLPTRLLPEGYSGKEAWRHRTNLLGNMDHRIQCLHARTPRNSGTRHANTCLN